MKHACLVLGVHAIYRGFGWILMEGPSKPIDWGVIEKKKDKNTQCLFAFERILSRYHPDILAIETFTAPSASRATRIRRLYRAMLSTVEKRGIKVRTYARSEIRTTFSDSGARSRYEIAQVIAKRIIAISDRLPKKRPVWESERPNLALFCAAAAALTHFANRD